MAFEISHDSPSPLLHAGPLVPLFQDDSRQGLAGGDRVVVDDDIPIQVVVPYFPERYGEPPGDLAGPVEIAPFEPVT